MRNGVYHAEYIVGDWGDAAALVKQLCDGYVSSFGSGNDQWEGLYMDDPGAVISLTSIKWAVLVSVAVPVKQVPRDYWLSPYTADTVLTYDKDGKDNRSEAYAWGMRFPRKEK